MSFHDRLLQRQKLCILAAMKNNHLLNLMDENTSNRIGEEYEYFSQPSPLYRNIAHVWATLAGIFSAQEILSSGKQWKMANNQSNFPEMVGLATEAIASKSNPHCFISFPDYVQLGISLPSFHLTFYHPKDSANIEQFKRSTIVARIISAYWPEFRPALKYQKQTLLANPNETQGPTKILPIGPAKLTAEYSLGELTKINPPYAPAESGEKGPSKYPALSEDYKSFKDCAFLRMNLVVEGIKGAEGYAPNQDSGDLVSSTYGVVYRIDFLGLLRFPLEYAAWAVCAKNIGDFQPLAFWQLVHSRNIFYNKTSKRRGIANIPGRIVSPLGSIIYDYQEQLTKGNNPVVKSNPEGMVITAEGEILWIPEIDTVGDCSNLLRETYDAQQQIVIPAKDVGLKDKPVFTDWLRDKLFYYDTAGKLEVQDLLGCRPLDAITIHRFLHRDIKEEVGIRFAQILEQLGVQGSPTILIQQIMRCPIPLSWADIGTSQFGEPDEFAEFKDWCQQFTNITRMAWSKFVKSPKVDFLTKMTFAMEIFLYLCKYTLLGEYTQIQKAFNEALQANNSPPINPFVFDPKKSVAAYNLPGLTGLMPHQLRVMNLLSTDPTGVILSAAPGSGKTTQGILQITRLLAEGKIYRPLVIAPGHLVKVWVGEINRWSKGKLNAFAVTRKTWNRWTQDLGLDEAQIFKMIKNQPKNTIFLTDYNFLSLGKTSYQYEDKWLPYMPMSIMMANFGFDHIIFDESHRTKNLESNRTQAALIMASRAKQVMLASGTIIHNVASDLVGQTALINPTVFYSKKSFNLAFATDDKGIVINESRREEIFGQIAPYARKITVDRQEWAYLLPEINEIMHPVNLTPNQQKFYNARMQDILDDIHADRKLMKLIESKDPSVDEIIEEALKRYFAKLEIFINAPDSDYGNKQYGSLFKRMQETTLEDLISPKMKIINEIIHKHTVESLVHPNGPKANISIALSPGKIIIFAYNVAVGKHIYEHLADKRHTLYYTAGNPEIIDQFINDPEVKILIAQEAGIGEGLNLQVADTIIRLQQPWTPGAAEQTLSRVLRPDVPDAQGKTKYNRQSITYHIIFTNSTLEVAKQARLLSKIIQKARIDYGDNKSFNDMYAKHENIFERMTNLSMNLDSLVNYSKSSDLTPYTDGYKIYKIWEDAGFEASRQALRDKLEEIYHRPISAAEVGSLAMQRVDGNLEIPGSQDSPSYTPWIEGAPPVDIHDLGIVPLSQVEPDEDEEDGEEKKNLPAIPSGTFVLTEFGPGYVEKSRQSSNVVHISVPGLSNEGSVKLNRHIVYVPTKKARAMVLEKHLAKSGPKGLPLLKFSNKTLVQVPHPSIPDFSQIKEKVPPVTTPPKPEKTMDTDEPIKLGPKPSLGKVWRTNIDVGVINFQPALFITDPDSKNISRLVDRGWKSIGNCILAKVKTYQGLLRLIDQLKSTYVIPISRQQEMAKFADLMKDSKNNLEKVRPAQVSWARNFFLDTLKRSKDRMEIHPYMVIWDSIPFVIINSTMYPIARKLLSEAKVTNVGKFIDAGIIYIRFFVNKPNLLKELQILQDDEHVEVTNKPQLFKDLKLIH